MLLIQNMEQRLIKWSHQRLRHYKDVQTPRGSVETANKYRIRNDDYWVNNNPLRVTNLLLR